jgi:ribosome-associated protein
MRKQALKYTDCPTETKVASILSWLEEKKALDTLALDLSGLSTFTDAMIICTASSFRHAQGLADHILDESKKAGFEFLRMEGYQAGQWILLDLNDLVLNIFVRETRDLYRLDELWPKALIVRDQRGIPR